jgi:hypothetical protein
VTVSNLSGSASATASWTVVPPTSAPTVSLVSAPSGSTTNTNATLSWTATNASSASCKLDGGAASSCSSPVGYTGLSTGAHTFTVTVSNLSGSASATASWTVVSESTPPGDSTAPQAPTPPSSYSVPSNAVVVSNSAGLISALSGSTRDIVLTDGVYDNGEPFENSNGHHLYAQHLGGAVLKAGLVIGGNYGATGGSVQGVVFDVSSSTKVLYGGEVHVWGPAGAGTKVLDCVFRGNKAIAFGLYVRNSEGLVAQRLKFYDFKDVGLWASDDTTVSYRAATPVIDTISDIYVNGVSRSVPGSSDGTAEAGLWIGHPVSNGVRRIEVHNVSWSGIETVNNSWDTVFTDLNIDMSGPNESAGVGIYLEHFSYHDSFQRFVIRGANTGINAEWNDPSWGGVAASHFSAFENGTIDATGANDLSHTIGIWLDAGTDSTTITGVAFVNQRWAGICEYEITGTNNITGNDFSGIAPGAVAVTTSHP